MKKRVLSLLLCLVLCFSAVVFFAACAKEKDNGPNYAKISVRDFGDIVVELNPSAAPETVANFRKLVNEKFYDGLTFHRIIKDFMIQGGDPKGNGTGGSGTNIVGEFKANGHNNPISHVRGVISMARASAYNSASSQFFICHADATYLDGQYAAFGRVVAGMDVVDAIANVAVNGSAPVQKVVMESIRLFDTAEAAGVR